MLLGMDKSLNQWHTVTCVKYNEVEGAEITSTKHI